MDVVLGANATLKTLLKKPAYLVIVWNFNDGENQMNVATLTTAGLKVDPAYQGRASIDEDGGLILYKTTSTDSGDYDISVISQEGTTTAGATRLRVLGEFLQGSRGPERESCPPNTYIFYCSMLRDEFGLFVNVCAPLEVTRVSGFHA